MVPAWHTDQAGSPRRGGLPWSARAAPRGSDVAFAPVAQLDRAGGFYPPGCGFDSCRGHEMDIQPHWHGRIVRPTSLPNGQRGWVDDHAPTCRPPLARCRAPHRRRVSPGMAMCSGHRSDGQSSCLGRRGERLMVCRRNDGGGNITPTAADVRVRTECPSRQPPYARAGSRLRVAGDGGPGEDLFAGIARTNGAALWLEERVRQSDPLCTVVGDGVRGAAQRHRRRQGTRSLSPCRARR